MLAVIFTGGAALGAYVLADFMDEGDAVPASGYANPVEVLVARIPVANWRVAAGVGCLTLAACSSCASSASGGPTPSSGRGPVAGGAALIWRGRGGSPAPERPARRARPPRAGAPRRAEPAGEPGAPSQLSRAPASASRW